MMEMTVMTMMMEVMMMMMMMEIMMMMMETMMIEMELIFRTFYRHRIVSGTLQEKLSSVGCIPFCHIVRFCFSSVCSFPLCFFVSLAIACCCCCCCRRRRPPLPSPDLRSSSPLSFLSSFVLL